MYLLWVVQDSLNLQKKVSDGDRHKEEDDGLIKWEVLIAFYVFHKTNKCSTTSIPICMAYLENPTI